METQTSDNATGTIQEWVPIQKKLPQLREAKGWSRERLSHEAYKIDPAGTALWTIVAIERGTRRPGLQTMAALAKALGEDPSVFAEYRLAIARYVLDEAQVGLEKALDSLEDSQLGSVEVPYEQIAQNSLATQHAKAREQRHLKKSA